MLAGVESKTRRIPLCIFVHESCFLLVALRCIPESLATTASGTCKPSESMLHSLQKNAQVLPCGHVPLGGCDCSGVSAVHASMDGLGSGALFPFRKCRLPIWKHLLHSVTNPGTRPGHHEHAGLRFHQISHVLSS